MSGGGECEAYCEKPMAEKAIKIPESCADVDRMMRNSKRFDVSNLDVKGVYALCENGRLIQATDPNRSDVWFLLSSGSRTVLIYNGEQLIPCEVKMHLGKPNEYRMDLKRYVIIYDNERTILDQKIAAFV